MKRRLFNAVALMSLVLSLLTLGLGLESNLVNHEGSWPLTGSWRFAVISYSGTLTAFVAHVPADGPQTLYYRQAPRGFTLRSLWQGGRLTLDGLHGIEMPHWFWAMIALVPALIWILVRERQKARHRRACPTCG